MIAIIWKRPTVGKWPRVDEFFWGAETEASASEQLDESVADEKKKAKKVRPLRCGWAVAAGKFRRQICAVRSRRERSAAVRTREAKRQTHAAIQPTLWGLLFSLRCAEYSAAANVAEIPNVRRIFLWGPPFIR